MLVVIIIPIWQVIWSFLKDAYTKGQKKEMVGRSIMRVCRLGRLGVIMPREHVLLVPSKRAGGLSNAPQYSKLGQAEAMFLHLKP